MMRKFTGIDDKKTWYVLQGDIPALEALKQAAKQIKSSVDRIVETRGYVIDDQLFLCKTGEKIPRGSKAVWAITRR